MVHIFELGEGGQGMQIRAGDQVIVPEGAIRMSLDPRKATGQFFRPGISWFAKQIFFDGLPRNLQGWTKEGLDTFLNLVKAHADRILKNSALLADLNLEDEADGDKALERLKDRDDLLEWWAMSAGAMILHLRESLERGDTLSGMFGMAFLLNSRTMLIFKEHLEETIWTGYRLGRLRDVLTIWKKNQDSDDEEFWQKTLTDYNYVLSQIFCFPVIILKDKAYVGGKNVDNTDGNIVDFLMLGSLNDNAALIEIKTPKTRLLGRRYRGVYNVSSELTGAVIQVGNYRDSLVRNHSLLMSEADRRFHSFDPPCLIIAGTSTELSDNVKRKSFELYRRGLRDVQVITYDELFGKVQLLVALLEGQEARSDASTGS